MIIRNVEANDINKVLILLKNNSLPAEDICTLDIDNFLLIEIDNEIVGVGGIEYFNDIALIRSFCINDKFKSRGLGKVIYNNIEQNAKLNGILELYLLTTTAQNYFKYFGFKEIKRNIVPSKIKSTNQFNELCPNSAIVMKKELN